MSKRIYLFATRSDYETTIKEFESRTSVRYVLCGLFESQELTEYGSIITYPFLGKSRTGDSIRDDTFLVIPDAGPLHIREVPQKKGGTMFAIDQLANPHSVVFEPAGLYQNHVLIQGEISTVSDDETSISIFRIFSGQVRRRFTRRDMFWFGPEALELQRDGMPAGMHVSRPLTFD